MTGRVFIGVWNLGWDPKKGEPFPFRALDGVRVHTLWAQDVAFRDLTTTDDVRAITHFSLPHGWVFWAGGKCPVPDGELVEVVFSGGTVSELDTFASYYFWGTADEWTSRKITEPTVILAYRVRKTTLAKRVRAVVQ